MAFVRRQEERASLRAGLRNFLPDVGKRAHRRGPAAPVGSGIFEGNLFFLTPAVSAVPLSTFPVDDNVPVRRNLVSATESELDFRVFGSTIDVTAQPEGLPR